MSINLNFKIHQLITPTNMFLSTSILSVTVLGLGHTNACYGMLNHRSRIQFNFSLMLIVLVEGNQQLSITAYTGSH